MAYKGVLSDLRVELLFKNNLGRMTENLGRTTENLGRTTDTLSPAGTCFTLPKNLNHSRCRIILF